MLILLTKRFYKQGLQYICFLLFFCSLCSLCSLCSFFLYLCSLYLYYINIYIYKDLSRICSVTCSVTCSRTCHKSCHKSCHKTCHFSIFFFNLIHLKRTPFALQKKPHPKISENHQNGVPRSARPTECSSFSVSFNPRKLPPKKSKKIALRFSSTPLIY